MAPLCTSPLMRTKPALTMFAAAGYAAADTTVVAEPAVSEIVVSSCTRQNCIDKDLYNLCEECEFHSSHAFTRGLVKRHHEAMLEFGGATVRFTTDRGVTHELVRHRHPSFAQESTRYANYSDGRFGSEITVIKPAFWDKDESARLYSRWVSAMDDCEAAYMLLLSDGATPQEARTVLPNSLATTIVVKANYREWRHILNLRAVGTTGRPHPQMQALMLPLLREFKQLVPVIFDDLEEK